jgi:protein arginine kinase
MMLDDLAVRCGEWLKGIGPESDIVMSSRIRLARNLASFPFIRRCNDIDRASIESLLRTKIVNEPRLAQLMFIDVAELAVLDRQLLVERQLISRELAESSGARAVAIDHLEQISLMINEEDHLRLQVIQSGLNLNRAWELINDVDDLVERQVDFAVHPRYGYLTACPTNVGTGMRVSVMVHLPALVIARQIDKVFNSLQKIGLAVRGLHGEGSQSTGDFYQISNQVTLGRSEQELVDHVSSIIPTVISYERKAREMLIKDGNHNLFDQVSRAIGLLQNAQQITSEETMHLLSKVRMGINLGLIGDIDIPVINKLFIHTQPAHLQKLRGGQLDQNNRNRERANYLHLHLKRRNGGPENPEAN